MRKSHRLHMGLPLELKTEIGAFAARRGLGLGAAVRLLVTDCLRSEASKTEQAPATTLAAPAALAALLAAEHAVLMVASVLPEGERRMRELGQRASLAAEQRLALFTGEAEG